MSTAATASEPAWKELRTELVRFVASRVGDAATADDIVHDVLLRALDALRGPEPPRQLRAWLYRSTRNAVVDHYRTRKPDAALPEDLPGEGPDEDDRTERELARCLGPLIRTLPRPYRRAVGLAEIDDLPQRVIAEREGISLSGAKSRVQRGRKMLRESLLACCRVEMDRRGGIRDYEPKGADGRCDCG